MNIQEERSVARGRRRPARARRLAAALALAGAVIGVRQAQAAHSSGTVHYTTVMVGGYPAFHPPGVAAYVPLDVTDLAPTATEGQLKKGQVIARHQLRAREAVVLDAPVTVGVQRALPAGAILVKTVSDRGVVAWCDVGNFVGILARNRVQCLADSSNQGKFDRSLLGWSFYGFMGLEAESTLSDGLVLGTAAPFHPAKPEERPTAVVGYRYCDGDGVVGPPRFAFTISQFGKPESFTGLGACAYGVWRNPADKSLVDVDGLQLKVSTAPGATPDAKPVISYQLQGHAPAGPLARLTGSGGLRVLVAAVPVARVASSAPSAPQPPVAIPPLPVPPVAAAAAPIEPVLVFSGRPAAHAGPIAIGQAVLTAPVKHGLTGTLPNRIEYKALFGSDTPLEVGQAMFGVPTSTASEIIWCAPRKRDTGLYDTACITGLGSAARWFPHTAPALLPWDRMYSGGNGGASSAPSVERKPIDLPPMTISFTLTGAKIDPSFPNSMIYAISWMLDWGEGPQKVRSLNYRVTQKGEYYSFLGLRIKLTQGADPNQLVAEVDPMQRGLVGD